MWLEHLRIQPVSWAHRAGPAVAAGEAPPAVALEVAEVEGQPPKCPLAVCGEEFEDLI